MQEGIHCRGGQSLVSEARSVTASLLIRRSPPVVKVVAVERMGGGFIRRWLGPVSRAERGGRSTKHRLFGFCSWGNVYYKGQDCRSPNPRPRSAPLEGARNYDDVLGCRNAGLTPALTDVGLGGCYRSGTESCGRRRHRISRSVVRRRGDH